MALNTAVFNLSSFNGTNGNDTLIGSDLADMINSLAGSDRITGNQGNDTLTSGGGNDTLIGGSGNNTLNGGAGDDNLNVDYSSGDNLLSGSDGNDTISASGEYGNAASGNNTLKGGAGDDILNADHSNSYNQGVDSIYDFNATNERIQVSAAGFGGGLSIGSLLASQFALGTSATTIAQRFIYDNTTGALYFDQDGSAGAFTQVQFAQLSAGVSLTKNNFVVV
ncbi:MAG: calcium-binding protein [Nostoc sp. S4]|nr:calcium-binding protein [Nostoc sp. S4]